MLIEKCIKCTCSFISNILAFQSHGNHMDIHLVTLHILFNLHLHILQFLIFKMHHLQGQVVSVLIMNHSTIFDNCNCNFFSRTRQWCKRHSYHHVKPNIQLGKCRGSFYQQEMYELQFTHAHAHAPIYSSTFSHARFLFIITLYTLVLTLVLLYICFC